MKKTVDAMGDACPIPVVKTKKVIEELKAQGGTVETFVDNEIAVRISQSWERAAVILFFLKSWKKKNSVLKSR